MNNPGNPSTPAVSRGTAVEPPTSDWPLIQSLLELGEKLSWVGRPVARRFAVWDCLIAGSVFAAMAVALVYGWIHFLGGWDSFVTQLARLGATPSSFAAVMAAGIAALYALFFALAYAHASRIIYAVTDRRAMVVVRSKRTVHNFQRGQFRAVPGHVRRDGVGTVNFEPLIGRPGEVREAPPHFRLCAFRHVPSIAVAEQHIRRIAADARPLAGGQELPEGVAAADWRILHPLLEPGEQVRWAARPLGWYLVLEKHLGVFIIMLAAFGAFLWFGAPKLLKAGSIQAYLALAGICAAALLAPVMLFLYPYLGVANTVYAVTDRRGLIVRTFPWRSVASFPHSGLEIIRKKVYRDGSGSLWFFKEFVEATGESSAGMVERGFLHAPRIAEAEEQIRRIIADGR